MTLRNRVSPFGEIIAVPDRGTLMGNRGILHDANQQVVKDWQVHRWIACRLEFRGRHRTVMTPGSYTELFFLDEAVALADGHRPCAECRHADFVAFQLAWQTAHPHLSPRADDIDSVLHSERRIRRFAKRTHLMELETLPDGAFVVLEDRAWLVRGETLHAWSPGGYVEQRRRPTDRRVTVLTPPAIVAAIHAGYKPGMHPNATTE